MGEIILVMENIEKSFEGVKAISDGRLALRRGEVHALMGENGAGKSTLMNILSGALRADNGTIRIEDRPVKISSPIEARALGIGKVHQELQLAPELTVGENIFLGREPRNRFGFLDYRKMYEESDRLIQSFGLPLKPKTKVKSLRVGERQFIEIVKVTSLDCRIVILDEPTSALSKAEAKKLFDVIARMKEREVSVIYITHRMEEVFEITDRITVMRDGRYIDTVNTAETNRESLIRMMVGRSVSAGARNKQDAGARTAATHGVPAADAEPARARDAEELLRVEDLSLAFPAFYKKTSLKNISFSLRKGEILGLAGLMGAGRTELFEALFGLHPKVRTGRVFIMGEEARIDCPEDAIGNRVAFMTEDRKQQGLVLSRGIGENMTLPILRRLMKFYFVDRRLERPLWERQMRDIRVKAPSPLTLASNLSGGNQQKVVFARWLLTEPDILLLDEPTRGIDVGAREEIYGIISSLAAGGKGILVVSSELPELLNICDRILTICEGRLTGDFAREEANQEALLSAATLHV
ncbi:MAG: sugar ABC transporter ATP-binding protein [Synergistaceae bacterium]|jgi:ABC-type sugar transport system ATPase subunit|nr:sugar ABC transporter ATP-binding protein [Synergistaceae bacterium]